ncbi:uracil-DNA glycosylase [Gymnodinialimonas sp. 2305UL16-5]|uniref:uracil-DNA glycosylase n=1 Tax=Gymnodinialimonas mytili TaxID=3126503 RepID=UPI00309E8652
MADDLTYEDTLAALAWQVELGADEAVLDHPVDRFDLPAPPPKPAPTVSPQVTKAAPVQHAAPELDAVAVARQLAEGANSLETLHAAMEGFEHCDLKRGARNFVFSDGHASARIMIVGEAPGRDEDLQGKPFVGRAGQLLDKMFVAIGLDRNVEGPDGLYITNMLPWRPPQNRDPKPAEIAMMRPFLDRHIALADPDILVLMGNHACAGLLGRRGITRMRGNWEEVLGRPAMPMFHPAYLLRNPVAKREAWSDLLSIKARLQ